MAPRTLICFPTGDAPGLRAEAAQLALGLAARGSDVIALGPLGPWRHMLRLAHITATDVSLAMSERKLAQLLQEYEPAVLHTFGAESAHLVLPLTQLVGTGGVATLGHDDLPRLNPAAFRTASVVFVPCEYLREQVARRLPATSVITTGYLLPPPEEASPTRNRFLAGELGLPDGAPVVLLADHFHGSETEVALALIEATPLIAERLPTLQVMIAGGGVRLGELEQRAIEVNDQLGRRVILLPGPRDDIAKLLALATVAVGSGRFAMEAVGAGVALVVAGTAGLVGTYTEKTTPVAHFSCCGRHGHLDPITVKGLASEVLGLFAYPEHRQRFAAEGQAALLATNERTKCAADIATYYQRSAPVGALTQTPQKITAVLPEDLREILFALPALAGLRMHYPLSRLHLMTSQHHQGLLRHMSLAERIFIKPKSIREWPTFLRLLFRLRADVCLAFGTDIYSALLTGLSRAPHRLGFANSMGSLFHSDHLHTQVKVSPARALALTGALGVTTGPAVKVPDLPADIIATLSRQLATAGISPSDPIILLCPLADELRTWLPQRWTSLASALAAARPERILVYNAGDLRLPAEVIPLAPLEDSLLLAALLARAELVISPDNEALHLADALGTPTLGLYGPTSPELCRLPGAGGMVLCHREFPCHPCMDRQCEERHCMAALGVEEVMAGVEQLLSIAAVEESSAVVVE
ncbi:MAG: glycosyltransferase family 9 protein [Armatimonadota bacterium]